MIPSAEPAPSPTRRVSGGIHRAWLVAAVAGLTIIIAGAFSTMPGLLLTPLHQEFEWSRGAIGFASSVNMVLYGLTAPFAAALMDRYGIRRVVACALLVISAGALLTTVMTAAWHLILLWGMLVGLGTGSMAMAFAATVTNRWFVKRRGLVTGILASASVFGQMIFLPLLAWVVDTYDWRPANISLALTAMVIAPLVWLFLRDHPADVGLNAYGSEQFESKPAPVPGAARRAMRVLRNSARTTPFWLMATAFAICGASTNGIMWTHFTPAAHDHGMPTTVAASLLAAIGIFNVAGTVASGWITDRYNARRILSIYFALRGLLLLFLPLMMSATVQISMMFFVVLFGLLDLATVPPIVALCREFYGEDSAIVFGWVNTAHQVGAALIAFAAGVARDTFGTYDMVWVAVGGLCAIAALLSLVIRRPVVEDSAIESENEAEPEEDNAPRSPQGAQA